MTPSLAVLWIVLLVPTPHCLQGAAALKLAIPQTQTALLTAAPVFSPAGDPGFGPGNTVNPGTCYEVAIGRVPVLVEPVFKQPEPKDEAAKAAQPAKSAPAPKATQP